MPAPLIPLLISAGASAGKAIHGGIQKRKARKALESMERPVYEQSAMLKENLAQAKAAAQQGLPSEVYERQAQNIDRQGAAATQNIRSLKGGLAGVGSAVQSQADAFSQLISQDAAAREANKQQLMAARTAMSAEEAKAFQMNQMTPFEEQRGALAQDMAVGQQNLAAGIDGLGAAAMQGAQMYSDQKIAGVGSGSQLQGQEQFNNMTPEQQEAIIKAGGTVNQAWLAGAFN